MEPVVSTYRGLWLVFHILHIHNPYGNMNILEMQKYERANGSRLEPQPAQHRRWRATKKRDNRKKKGWSKPN